MQNYGLLTVLWRELNHENIYKRRPRTDPGDRPVLILHYGLKDEPTLVLCFDK